MEFGNPDFWHVVCSHRGQQLKTPLRRGSFPRGSAIQLAHATLMLAWISLRTDPLTARILLGMARSVSELIARLKFDEVDSIAHKRFRHVRPRWDDRPALWRRLLLAAQSDDAKLLGALNLHAPYVGVAWTRSFGATEDLVRAAGGDPTSVVQFVLGLRAWF